MSSRRKTTSSSDDRDERPRPRAATPRSSASPRGRGRSRGARQDAHGPRRRSMAPGSECCSGRWAPRFPRSPVRVLRGPRERRRGRPRRRRSPASARPPAGQREAPARPPARARPEAGRQGGHGAGLRPPTPRASTRLRRTLRRMPTWSLRALWTTRGRAPPDRRCRSGPGRRQVRGCPAPIGSPLPRQDQRRCRGPAPESARRARSAWRAVPRSAGGRMRIDRPPLTLPGRAHADELPAGLLDGTVGTGHHAHPRRNSPSTRPSPRPGLRRSWAQPLHGVTPNRCDSPKRTGSL